MLSTLALAAVCFRPMPPQLEVDYASRTGLTINYGTTPIVRGSWFQYYEPGWTKGYYSSSWNEQTVTRESPTQWTVKFKSGNGLAHGTIHVEQVGTKVNVVYRLGWNGPSQANVELCAGMIWAPFLTYGTLEGPGRTERPLGAMPGPKDTMDKRLVFRGQNFSLANGLGSLKFEANQAEYDLFDGRNYDQDWSRERQLYWLGTSSIPIQPKGEWSGRITYQLDVKTKPAPDVPQGGVHIASAPGNLAPEPPLPLVPEPKSKTLDSKRVVEPNAFDAESDRNGIAQALNKVLVRRFGKRLPTTSKPQKNAIVITSRLKSSIEPGGYELKMDGQRVGVAASNREGFLNAAHTLGMLARSQNGKVVIPQGTIADWPSTDWRGVHLFVGPTAPEFQRKLWETVLRPMKFNQVVLQLERTDWESQPGIKTSITMPKSGLSRLKNMYGELGVEITPLIQSFGHMEWLFANNQNLDLAFNPDVLYSVDPRLPRTDAVLREIWAECIAALSPKIIHFGLDEINMRGWPDDHKLVTDLWAMQMPKLAKIAEDHKVGSMIWGDMGLAPGEAIDAMNGDTKQHALDRRNAIPKGTFVADWHYRADPNPDGFRKSLKIWKDGGHLPIASAWNRPNNIRGFAHAAILEDAGFLQTTWAGYESNEFNMLREFDQFTAMILAADYSWSGRKELPDELPYNPGELFRRLYFEPKEITGKIQPFTVVGSASVNRGFYFAEPMEIPSLLSASSSGATEIHIGMRRQSSPSRFESIAFGKGELLVWVSTETESDENAPVAEIQVLGDSQKRTIPLNYGIDLRSTNDQRALGRRRGDGATGAIIRVPILQQANEIRIVMKNPALGLRVLGMGWLKG